MQTNQQWGDGSSFEGPGSTTELKAEGKIKTCKYSVPKDFGA